MVNFADYCYPTQNFKLVKILLITHRSITGSYCTVILTLRVDVGPKISLIVTVKRNSVITVTVVITNYIT